MLFSLILLFYFEASFALPQTLTKEQENTFAEMIWNKKTNEEDEEAARIVAEYITKQEIADAKEVAESHGNNSDDKKDDNNDKRDNNSDFWRKVLKTFSPLLTGDTPIARTGNRIDDVLNPWSHISSKSAKQQANTPAPITKSDTTVGTNTTTTTSAASTTESQKVSDYPPTTIISSDSIESIDEVNLDYEYEDRDIFALLILRAQEAGLNLNNNIIMPPLGDSPFSVAQQLQQEINRHLLSRANHARNIIFPLYLNAPSPHWTGVIVRLDENNRVIRIIYIDTLGRNGVPNQIRRVLENIYDNGSAIEEESILIQTDGTSCGPLTVENLVFVAKHLAEERSLPSERRAVSKKEAIEIRARHMELLEIYHPELGFKSKQKDNVSNFFPGKNRNPLEDMFEYKTSKLNYKFRQGGGGGMDPTITKEDKGKEPIYEPPESPVSEISSDTLYGTTSLPTRTTYPINITWASSDDTDSVIKLIESTQNTTEIFSLEHPMGIFSFSHLG